MLLAGLVDPLAFFARGGLNSLALLSLFGSWQRRTFLYTHTSLPPPFSRGAKATIKLLREDKKGRERGWLLSLRRRRRLGATCCCPSSLSRLLLLKKMCPLSLFQPRLEGFYTSTLSPPPTLANLEIACGSGKKGGEKPRLRSWDGGASERTTHCENDGDENDRKEGWVDEAGERLLFVVKGATIDV